MDFDPIEKDTPVFQHHYLLVGLIVVIVLIAWWVTS